MKKILLGTLFLFSLLTIQAQKVSNKKVKTKYLQLPNYNMVEVDPAGITADFVIGESSYGEASLKNMESMCVPKGGSLKDVVKLTTYYYSIKVDRSSGYLIAKDNTGKVIYADKVSAKESTKTSYGKDECKNWIEQSLVKNYKENKNSIHANEDRAFEKMIYDQSVIVAKSNIFISEVEEEFQLNSAKGDFDYAELDKAFDIAMAAYKSISNSGPSTTSHEKLGQAIKIWEKELESSDPENKKARINAKVSRALQTNIAIAMMYRYELGPALKNARKADASYGGFTNNNRIALKEMIKKMEYRKLGADKNSDLVKNLASLNSKAKTSMGMKAHVTKLNRGEINNVKLVYKEFKGQRMQEDLNEREKEVDEAISDGSMNKYDRYVTQSATQGKMLMITALTEKLTEFPKEICAMTDLKQITISMNKMTSIPSCIGDISALKVLNLTNNKITSIPAEIGKLTNLEKLKLSRNPITTVPDELQNCKNLKKIDLSGTNISAADQAKITGWFPEVKIKF